MTRLAALETKAANWARVIAALGLAGLLFEAFAILADVVSRWLFNAPIFGLGDINGILIGVIVASFFPILLIERGNVSLELLSGFLSPRAEAWLGVFGHLITAAFIALIAWQLMLHAQSVATQETLILRLPVAPGWWATTALIGFCVPVQLVVLAVHVTRAVTGEPGPTVSDFG